MTNETDVLVRLGTQSADLAMKSAVSWLAVQGKAHLVQGNAKRLVEDIRDEIKFEIGKALDDAKEAIAAHMPDIAVRTFSSSMQIAGIRAAKKFVLGIEGSTHLA
jgi:hypothetical protein